jgi:hypothetical protein
MIETRMTMEVPVIYLAPSEARNDTRAAMSSSSPFFFKGTSAACCKVKIVHALVKYYPKYCREDVLAAAKKSSISAPRAVGSASAESSISK